MGDPPSERLDGSEVAARTKAAIGPLLARSIVIRGLGMVSYLVLARMLSPRDFGIASVGLTITFFAGFLADAGLGAAFVRGAQPPTRHVLGALVGLQLILVSAVVAPIVVWCVLTGWNVVAVTALLYVASLWPATFRVPAVLHLERRLEFRPIVAAEIGEVVAFDVLAVAGVALGFGVETLGAASVLKSFVGTAMMVWSAPVSVAKPNLDVGTLRPAASFGVLSQAGNGVTMARDQAINYGTATIASLTTLGLWSLASKVMLIPAVLFESLFRISYPAFSRMADAGEDLRPLLRRSTATLSIIVPVVLLPLVTGGPALIPVILGRNWSGVGRVLPLLCLGTAASIPVSSSCDAALWARGDAGLVLGITTINAMVMVTLTFALMPSMGLIALGVAASVAAITTSVLTGIAVRQRFGVNVLGTMLVSLLAAAVAVGVTAAAMMALGPSALVRGTLGIVLSTVAYIAILVLLRRGELSDAVRLIGRITRLQKRGSVPSHPPGADGGEEEAILSSEIARLQL